MDASAHKRANELLSENHLDGLQVDSFGGAYGPSWEPQQDYDLDFLQHYEGIRTLYIRVRARSLQGIQAVAKSLQDLTLGEPAGRDYAVSASPLSSCERLSVLSCSWAKLSLEPLVELPLV